MNESITKINDNQLITRPPIVVILGHIDHGKTTLLDYIRKTNVVAKESGGITQHIGAYEISHTTQEGQTKRITFIDTPGHEAFSKMRGRGVKVADIAIVVVAADEGVKPQTLEALDHVAQCGAILIIAINKIDKPEANPQKVKQQLAEKGILLEGWGGNVPNQEISAKSGKGVNELLDLILLAAELEDFKADSSAKAEGVIIEAHKDAQKGNIATLLIRNGTLRVGEFIAAGDTYGKVKAMATADGKSVAEASFSSPVIITGFETTPQIGESFTAFPDKTTMLNSIKMGDNEVPLFAASRLTEAESQLPIINLIIKTDVAGSKEALEKMLDDLKFKKAAVKVIKSELGEVNEKDMMLAKSANATIAAFKVKTSPEAAKLAQSSEIALIQANVIYELIDQIKEKIKNILPQEVSRIDLGKLTVLVIFKSEPQKIIIGGKVADGKVKKGAFADVKRNGNLILTGKISQLQHNKADVAEVQTGRECGIMFAPTATHLPGGRIEPQDKLEIYEEERKPQILE